MLATMSTSALLRSRQLRHCDYHLRNACQCAECTDADKQSPARTDLPIPTTARDACNRIASVVCSLAFLTGVALAAWIVISAGAGVPTWQ